MTKLILTRHGQSVWNLEKKFTGWVDVDLSPKGVEEANGAIDKLKHFHLLISRAAYLCWVVK